MKICSVNDLIEITDEYGNVFIFDPLQFQSMDIRQQSFMDDSRWILTIRWGTCVSDSGYPDHFGIAESFKTKEEAEKIKGEFHKLRSFCISFRRPSYAL